MFAPLEVYSVALAYRVCLPWYAGTAILPPLEKNPKCSPAGIFIKHKDDRNELYCTVHNNNNYDKLTKQSVATFETLRTNPLTLVDEGSHTFLPSQFQVMMVSYVVLRQR